jgi:hypothetical protein
MKYRNSLGTKFSGALGKDVVAASWKGQDYFREYAAPANPKSDLQVEHRTIFIQAVEAWKGFSVPQQKFYARIADGMTGYNVYVGRHIRAVRNGVEPEVPQTLAWTTQDGQPLAGAWLIVRAKGKALFVDSLKDASAEVALTPSDGPYEIVLRKRTMEDVVLTVSDLAAIPDVLESELLGITLVLVGPEDDQSGAPEGAPAGA